MVIIRSRKGGSKYPITPPKGPRSSGFDDSLRHNKPKFRRPTSEELHAHVWQLNEQVIRHEYEEWAKRLREQIPKEKQEVFEHALILLKPAVPFIASIDPHIATIYGAYRFCKFGYEFASEVNKEAKKVGSFEKALLIVSQREFDQIVTSKFESLSIKGISEYAGRMLWTKYKEHYPDMEITEKLDQHAENALIHTLEEIGGAVV